MTRVMRWDCNRDGCFNIKHRLKFGVFDGIFPRGINFTDVDGLVEIGKKFCMIEWKGDGGGVHYAQDRAYKAFTANADNVVVVVYGDAEDMSVRSFGYYRSGEYSPAKVASLDDLKRWLREWAASSSNSGKHSTWNQMWAKPYTGPDSSGG